MVDYIHVNNKGIIITTNIACPSDLLAIEKYIKSTTCVEAEQVQSLRLSQSKSYLKIVGVPYLSKSIKTCITSNDIERILKSNHRTFKKIHYLSIPSSKSNPTLISSSFRNHPGLQFAQFLALQIAKEIL